MGIINRVFDRDQPPPERWLPEWANVNELREVKAFAYPTPFAWAKEMEAILRHNLYDHILFKLYKKLILGLTLGHLRLEIIDLKRGGVFAKVLAQADERFRYFGLLRGDPQNQILRNKVFGGTSPDSLFWPSPRRSEEEWTELEQVINQDGQLLRNGVRLLAYFRSLLDGAWEGLPWVGGLNQVIGDTNPNEGQTIFHCHTRFVGPISVSFPNWGLRPLYFPVYERGFASEFLRGLTGSFKGGEGKVSLCDDRGVEQFEILRPTVPPDGDAILAGLGIVRPVPGQIRKYGATRVKVGELYTYFPPQQFLRNREPIQEVRQFPFFYPDVLRIPITRLKEAGDPDGGVSFSDRAYVALAFEPEGPGLPECSNIQAAGAEGYVWEYRDKRIIYLERYQGRSVGDLRALGWALWSFFVGDAQYENGRLSFRGRPLLVHSDERPLDVTYPEVPEQPQGGHRRLASLQRFVRFYADYAEREHENPIAHLCFFAARAFARWAWGEEVIPNGPPPNQVELQLGQIRMRFARQ